MRTRVTLTAKRELEENTLYAVRLWNDLCLSGEGQESACGLMHELQVFLHNHLDQTVTKYQPIPLYSDGAQPVILAEIDASKRGRYDRVVELPSGVTTTLLHVVVEECDCDRGIDNDPYC